MRIQPWPHHPLPLHPHLSMLTIDVDPLGFPLPQGFLATYSTAHTDNQRICTVTVYCEVFRPTIQCICCIKCIVYIYIVQHSARSIVRCHSCSGSLGQKSAQLSIGVRVPYLYAAWKVPLVEFEPINSQYTATHLLYYLSLLMFVIGKLRLHVTLWGSFSETIQKLYRNNLLII